MIRVDSHLHVNLHGLGPRELIAYLDRERIDTCWLLSWDEQNPGPWPYQKLSAEDIHQTWQRFGDRVVPMYAPDPHRADACQRLTLWQQRGFRGCGELKTTLSWQSVGVRRLVKTVAELGLPVVFHMQALRTLLEPLPGDGGLEVLLTRIMRTQRLGRVTHGLVNQLVDWIGPLRSWRERRSHFNRYLLDFVSLGETLEEFPSVKFVAHGPLWWQRLSSHDKATGIDLPRGPVRGEGLACQFLERYPNLYADISGGSGHHALSRDRRFARRFCEKYSDKLLFGTDNSVLGHAALLDSLGLGIQTRRKIYGQNALDVLGL